jgi:flagellar hook-associated protein FlgK
MVGTITQTLYGAVNAMNAHQQVMGVSSKNIGNANTEGYSRQRSELVA